MSSNSHKTRSIQDLLQYDNAKEFNVLPDENERKQIIERAKEVIGKGEILRNKIKERCLQLSNETMKQQELLRK